MKALANQICSAFGNKKGQAAAGRQVIELSARKDLLSKMLLEHLRNVSGAGSRMSHPGPYERWIG